MLAQTLIWFQAAIAALLGLALAGIGIARRDTRMCLGAGLALLLLAVANSGLALRGSIPDALSIVVAGMLFPLAFVIFHRAVARFVHPDQQARDELGWVLVALVGLSQCVFTWVYPSIGLRAIVLLGVSALQIARITLLLSVFARGTRGSGSSRLLAWVMGLYGVTVLGTGLLIAAGLGPVAHLFQPTLPSLGFLVLRVILITLLAFLVARVDLSVAAAPGLRAPDEAERERRMAGEEAIRKALARARKERKPFALAMVLVDGHAAAAARYGTDEARLLVDRAETLCAAHLRHDDLSLRVAPDAFVIAMPGLGVTDAEQAARVLRILVAKRTPAFGDPPIPGTVSIGLAALGPGRASLGDLLPAARAAAQLAQHRGGNDIGIDARLRQAEAARAG